MDAYSRGGCSLEGGILDIPVSRVGAYSRGRLIEALRYLLFLYLLKINLFILNHYIIVSFLSPII